MSRVHRGQKYVNSPHYPKSITSSSKVKRTCEETANYKNAKTLVSWLAMKHRMSYGTYRKKPKTKRDELRAEYIHDTGNTLPSHPEEEKCKNEKI